MNTRMKWVLAVTVAALMVLSPSCEDSDVSAPAGSTITLQAAPETIFINQDAGETQGTAEIIAQVTDSNGLPLEDIVVFFTTDGGLLDTVHNFCRDGFCTHVTDETTPCTSDAQCEDKDPVSVQTNVNGVAFNTLTLRLIEDPDSVEVTGQATNFSGRVQVTKTVNLGPVDPVAIIEAVPDDGQRTGFPFSFDGSNSTFDPQVEITCFDWTVVSSVETVKERGPNLSVITQTVGFPSGQVPPGEQQVPDQDLTVTLRVSDESGINCSNGVDPDTLGLSVFSDTISYRIRCDLTDPQLANIGTQTLNLLSDGTRECLPSGFCKEFPTIPCTPEFVELDCPLFLNLDLTAVASDPEDPTLLYTWDCGNGTTITGESNSVTCVYTDQTTVTREGSVTVQNDCGRSVSDTFTIQINAAN